MRKSKNKTNSIYFALLKPEHEKLKRLAIEVAAHLKTKVCVADLCRVAVKKLMEEGGCK